MEEQERQEQEQVPTENGDAAAEAPSEEAPSAGAAAETASEPAPEQASEPPAEAASEAPSEAAPEASAEAVPEAPAEDEPEAPAESAGAEEEAGVPPAAAAEAEPAAPSLVEMAAEARYSATGKRKTSIARVILRPGNGGFELNGRALDVYFPRPTHQAVVKHPLEVTGYLDRVDVRARIHGGGISGQADALRHGIAKALMEIDPNLRGELKRRQLLTRDPRVKERRKAGLKKARKRPQFSKR
jgi:small subunit ribosomal protein S9